MMYVPALLCATLLLGYLCRGWIEWDNRWSPLRDESFKELLAINGKRLTWDGKGSILESGRAGTVPFTGAIVPAPAKVSDKDASL